MAFGFSGGWFLIALMCCKSCCCDVVAFDALGDVAARLWLNVLVVGLLVLEDCF